MSVNSHLWREMGTWRGINKLLKNTNYKQYG